MKTKILLWSVVSILIIGLAAGVLWWLWRPQVIVFSDGSKLTLVGVTYGKHHVSPEVKKKETKYKHYRNASFDSTNDTLVVWVRQQHDPQQWANFQYYLYDEAGTACVGNSGMNFGNGNGRQDNQVVGVQFGAFPRRQGKFILRVQEQGNNGQEMSDQKFVIRNPARGSLPTWIPDSLPDTQQDDDLSVTLTKLVAGVDLPYTRDNDDPDDAVNKGVQATFNVQRNGKPVTNWEPVSVETSDATGNQINGWVAKNDWSGNDGTAVYQYGLWPDEPAWKIRLEFSQKSDFAGDELWSVHGIPVKPGRQMDFWNYNNRRGNTHAAFAETDLNGFHLKIFPAIQFADMPPNSQPQGGLFIQTEPPLPNGMRLTVVKLTDDQTNDIGFWENTYNQNQNASVTQCELRDLGGATNLNLTIALHKSRFVEFTVKPEKAPSSDNADNANN